MDQERNDGQERNEDQGRNGGQQQIKASIAPPLLQVHGKVISKLFHSSKEKIRTK